MLYTSTRDKNVKVTSAPADWSGEYLIVYEAGNVAFNGGLTTLDAVSNTIPVTIVEDEIASTEATDAAKFTINSDGNISILSISSSDNTTPTSFFCPYLIHFFVERFGRDFFAGLELVANTYIICM